MQTFNINIGNCQNYFLGLRRIFFEEDRLLSGLDCTFGAFASDKGNEDGPGGSFPASSSTSGLISPCKTGVEPILLEIVEEILGWTSSYKKQYQTIKRFLL